MNNTPNQFKQTLAKRQQLGIFSTLGSNVLAELFGGCGFDWILLDTEHSPNDLSEVVSQLQALAGLGTNAIARPAWSDMVLVKRLMDAGVRTILFPSIQSAEMAAEAVSFTRYPPAGVRGVSGSSRAAQYGQNPKYLTGADEHICVLVQIETPQGLDNLEEIALTEGVDGVFIGPADLAASLGHLGNPQHPDVQKAIDGAFRHLKKLGKPAGYLTVDETEAARRLAEGVDFVGIAVDAVLISRASTALIDRMAKHRVQ